MGVGEVASERGVGGKGVGRWQVKSKCTVPASRLGLYAPSSQRGSLAAYVESAAT